MAQKVTVIPHSGVTGNKIISMRPVPQPSGLLNGPRFFANSSRILRESRDPHRWPVVRGRRESMQSTPADTHPIPPERAAADSREGGPERPAPPLNPGKKDGRIVPTRIRSLIDVLPLSRACGRADPATRMSAPRGSCRAGQVS